MSYYPGNPVSQQGYVQNYPPPQYPPATTPPPAYPPTQAGYPPSNQPGYPPSSQPGYPPSNQPGYPPSNQPGYPPPNQPGYPPSNQPGYPPAQNYSQPTYPPAQNYPQPPHMYPPQQAYPAAPGYAAPSPYPSATSWSPQAYPAPYPVAVATPYPVAAAPTYPVAYAATAVVATPGRPAVFGLNYHLQFKGVRLDRKDVFSKSDPFLILMASKHPGGYLSRQQIKRERKETKKMKKFGEHSNNWVVIHRTETIYDCQNPVWQPFVVNLYTLCAGNLDTPFKIEVWDSDSHSAHDFIGSCVTTIRDLQVMREVRLINKRRIGIFNSSGQIEVLKCAPA